MKHHKGRGIRAVFPTREPGERIAKPCEMCGGLPVLRRVGTRGFCKKHLADAAKFTAQFHRDLVVRSEAASDEKVFKVTHEQTDRGIVGLHGWKS